jgi:hypothetical protein
LQAFVLNDLVAYGRKSMRDPKAFFGELMQRDVSVGIADTVSNKKMTESCG